jgi:hypothetical protein
VRGRSLATALLLLPALSTAEETNIDFFTGPVVSASRVIGMGGAYTGVGEGADGHLINPASFAVRYNWAADDWFDYDWASNQLVLPANGEIRLDLSGQRYDFLEAKALDGGFHIKLGNNAFGLHYADVEYLYENTTATGQRRRTLYRQRYGGIAYARSLHRGNLHAGVLLAAASAGIWRPEVTKNDGETIEEQRLLTVTGSGLQTGLLWTPVGRPWRAGLSWRRAIIADNMKGIYREGFAGQVPNRLIVPAQLSLGLSYRFGKAEYNPAPDAPRKKSATTPDRRYLLIAGDLVVTDAAKRGMGTLAFLNGELQRSGEHISLSPRLGLEAEVLADRLRLRAGSYYEPNRFTGPGRLHATAGIDLRLSLWLKWKLSFAIDVAEAYTNSGFGLGVWH